MLLISQTSNIFAIIHVTYPVGNTCTCTDGTETWVAEDTNGEYSFIVPKAGNYIIETSNGTDTARKGVKIKYQFSIEFVELTIEDYSYASIAVTYPEGSICTCQKDDLILKAEDTSGYCVFNVPETGQWTVTITDGSKISPWNTTINEKNQIQNMVIDFYIISLIHTQPSATPSMWSGRGISGLNYLPKETTPSIGTITGTSDFSSIYPWSEIKRETLSTGDVMVKIPKFWYRCYYIGPNCFIEIADKANVGFPIHPAFKRNGIECDYIYVGAYKTSSNNKSVSGSYPQINQTRATMRANAKAKGEGWGLIDISTLSAIQMLILMEFVDNNIQAKIGRGYCDGNTTYLQTGTCDSVPLLIGRPVGTDGKTDVIWRGIEGLWGSLWEFIDGVNVNNGTYYVCNDPSKYADDTTIGYTQLSYTGATNWDQSYITEMGLDTSNSYIILPTAAGTGSESTYWADGAWSGTGWTTLLHGGSLVDGSKCGLFATATNFNSSYSNGYIGSRLLYIPS